MASIYESGPRLLEAVQVQMRLDGATDEPNVTPFRAACVEVHLRNLTSERRAALLLYQRQNPGDDLGVALRMLAWSVCDAAGNLTLSIDGARRLGDTDPDRAAAIIGEVLRRNKLERPC